MYLDLMISIQMITKQTDKERPDYRGNRIPVRELKYQQAAFLLETVRFTCCHSKPVTSYSFQALSHISCSLTAKKECALGEIAWGSTTLFRIYRV